MSGDSDSDIDLEVDLEVDPQVDPYGPLVRALFERPEHAGAVTGGVSAGAEGPEARVQLFARPDGETVTHLGFRAWGCPHVIAAAEYFCANHQGSALSELEAFDVSEIIEKLSVPAEKTGRILVLEDAVRALCGRLRQ